MAIKFFIGVSLLWALLLYILFSFVTMEISPAAWSIDGRIRKEE